MAITTYAELVTAVENWLDDDTLTARIPEMIALAEAEFNRRLNTIEMEARAFTTATGEYVTLPDDWSNIRAVYLTDADYVRLEQMSLPELRAAYAGRWTGQPANYALVDDQLVLGPIPDSSRSIEILYTQKIPSLSVSNTTNWLLDSHPDLYLFATLQQAEFFNWDDRRVTLVNARVEAIMGQITKDGTARRAGSSPIRMRVAYAP